MTRINRRRFLTGVSAASIVGLAGCSMFEDTNDEETNGTETPTDTDGGEGTDEGTGTDDGSVEEYDNVYSSTLQNIDTGETFDFVSLDHVEAVRGREQIGEEVHIRVQLTEEGQTFFKQQYEAANASENYESLEVEYFFKGLPQENKLLRTSPHTTPEGTSDGWNGEEVLVVSTAEQADEIEANV